jgi:hypothetical protein
MLVFAALRSGSLDHRRVDEEELHVGANALHRAASRERYTSGGLVFYPSGVKEA